ncbi:transcriptional regulator [Oscillospiraceae bacterium]|nr:transcriptional regulator [Oscillospiraceae bacterium]BDF75874.1 transcriptional regulator [Oscillospiraceae bacterium]
MQTDRLFQIVWLLLERGTVTAKELAQRFEVSVRTVYRDVDALCAAGVPVRAAQGRGGGFSLMEGFVLDRSALTRGDREQMLLALQSVAAAGQAGAGEALERLGAFLGREDGSWLEVDFSPWGDGGGGRAVFEALRDAAVARRVAAFSYYGADGTASQRVVEPLKLVFRGQGWYLWAWCRKRRDLRYFKLTRIRGLEVLEERFDRPRPGPRPAGGPAYSGESVRLALRLGPEQAHRVLDEMGEGWTREADGSFLVRLDFPQGGWLWGWLLSFGEGLEVLEPEWVRAGLRDRLRGALKRYET